MRWALMAISTLVVSLAAPSLGVGQQPANRISLDEALQLALRQNPTLMAQQAALFATKAGETTAALRPNPTMNFLAEQFRPGQSQQDAQYTVNVGQPIELGGKRQRRIDSARAATQVAKYQLDDARRLVVLQVKSAFAGALIAREQLGLAEANLKTLDDTERIQRLRAQKGDISELELLRIEVQRFTFARDAADARQALTAAKIALRTAAGAVNIPEDFEVAGELGQPAGSASRRSRSPACASRPPPGPRERLVGPHPAARVPADRTRRHHRLRVQLSIADLRSQSGGNRANGSRDHAGRCGA